MSTLQLDSLPVSAASKPNPTFTRIKPPPVFGYRPSPDGVDTNLLILLHGLGDTDKPFLALGTRLNLPQTAILALRAFERVPLLEEDCFQWWDSFDILTGLPLSNPNPSSALNKLIEILDVLISKQIGWEPQRIHLFGFGQGGSCVAELALLWNRVKPNSSNLGSLVSISGPLLSLPTIEPESRSISPSILLKNKCQQPQKSGNPFSNFGLSSFNSDNLGRLTAPVMISPHFRLGPKVDSPVHQRILASQQLSASNTMFLAKVTVGWLSSHLPRARRSTAQPTATRAFDSCPLSNCFHSGCIVKALGPSLDGLLCSSVFIDILKWCH
ncbi:hypothetical protein O181_066015 [Austropuccinia psidii MF-1]|uniref:Phospholipase/carboxylesterase/thioesterase domain-containing protein n=1 Tax=Austropuccinia psidii MF-1 TaxID=1389203 RepID=A0A9Q3I4P0_9BASI|nr:hypothetical protein [Austropuccinia psidii MF-1]